MSNDKSQNLPKTETWKARQDLRSYKNKGIITDGPYAWGIYKDTRIARIEEAGTDEEQARHAAFIVKACNNHDELIKALNVISDSLLEAIDLLEISEKTAYLERWETERKAAKILLAKIEGA